MVKNQPAMWESWVQFLVWDDPLEKGIATQYSVLAWIIMIKEAVVYGVTKSLA